MPLPRIAFVPCTLHEKTIITPSKPGTNYPFKPNFNPDFYEVAEKSHLI
jgi:hypothetical protein